MAQATAVAENNSGDGGSGTRAVASERPFLVVGRRRRGNGGGRGKAVASVSVATVDGGNGAGKLV